MAENRSREDTKPEATEPDGVKLKKGKRVVTARNQTAVTQLKSQGYEVVEEKKAATSTPSLTTPTDQGGDGK